MKARVFSALTALSVVGAVLTLSDRPAAADPPWPTAPPAAICGNAGVLTGPSAPPTGAITVPAGDNSAFDFNQPGATFWFAPGTHTLADDLYGQISAKPGTSYIGGPGAILDGRNINLYAFTGDVAGVTIKYLTVKNFGRGLDNQNEGVVNHDSGSNWVIQYNTVIDNDGAGVFLGSGDIVSYNCLKDNGQYGFSMFKMPIEGDSAIKNIVLDHNEIAGNNTDDWESRISGCGCTGGGKFWDVNGATVTNNYVHDNKSTGLWADTNNIDFLFEGNFIDHNDGEGIWYEISYNATMRNNTLTRNAWVSGNNNLGSPGPAIYLSESGGDARLASTVSGAAAIRIYDNLIQDNFSGVSIYENANRFCNSNGNTSTGYCTPFITPTLIPEPHDSAYANPINNTHPCFTNITSEPYLTDCRWHAKNIEVRNNEFRFDSSVVPCAGSYCGVQALMATGADNLLWSPYTVAGVQNAVMFTNNNSFHDNQYFGNWRFAKAYGDTIAFNAWRTAPFNQDAGSTFDGDQGGTPSNPSASDLDADTATLEGSIGQWQDWYAETASRSADAKHSGSYGLRVDVTAANGWGVQTGNWPGFASSPGIKKISLWGKLGSGTNLQPKMTVKWLDASAAVLRSDEVVLPVLTTTWQSASALVDAPVGTANALVALHGAGSAGDYLYLDDFVVGNAPNLLDADTAGAGSTVGQWQSWYSANVAAVTQEAHSGSGSLCVTVTDSWGWALSLANWPGFTTGAGAKRISFWGKQGAGSVASVTLRVKWLDASQTLLQTDLVPITALSTSWQQATSDVTAPTGTATALLEIYSTSGAPNDSLYLDDLLITDVV